MPDDVFPLLHSERLVFDQLTPSDGEHIFAIFSDPDVIRHYDVSLFTDPQEGPRLIEYFQARFDSGTGIRWAIREKTTGTFLGSCGFNAWNEFDYTAVIGYELNKAFWGKGFATEAINRITDFIFADDFKFHVNRVEALILPSNKPSINAAERCGFQREGTMRGKCYWNGAFHDMDMYSLLREDKEK